MENAKTDDMRETCRKIMRYLNANDAFCRDNGIRLTEVAGETARAELTVAPHLLNASGVVQGGAIFALCDLAFAGVANSGNERTVAQNASISYLRPGTGSVLRAEARLIHRGRRSAVIRVDVTDDRDKLVATASITGCPLGIPTIREEDGGTRE